MNCRLKKCSSKITPHLAECIKQFKAHAIETYPNEACALIYNDHLKIVDNHASEPENHFVIPLDKMLGAYRSKTGIQLLLHSHPVSNCQPSHADNEGMIATGCDWLIYSVKHDTIWIGDRYEGEILRCPK